MKYFNNPQSYTLADASKSNSQHYQTIKPPAQIVSVMISPTLSRPQQQKTLPNSNQKVVLAEGGISQITSSIIKGYMSDKIAKTTGKGADLASHPINGQHKNGGVATMPITVTSMGQKYRSPQQSSSQMGSGGQKKVKISKLQNSIPSQSMLMKQSGFENNGPLRQPQQTKQFIPSKKVSERGSPQQYDYTKGSLVTQSKLGMHRNKRSEGDAQNLTKITMLHLRTKPPPTIFPSSTLAQSNVNNENRKPSSCLDDSLRAGDNNPYFPVTQGYSTGENNRPPSSHKYQRHNTVMGTKPSGTQCIVQPSNPAPALLERDLNSGFGQRGIQLPYKINPNRSGGKRENTLKEDNSLDSLQNFTSFANAPVGLNSNQERITLTKSLIETSLNVNLIPQREVTPKLGHQHPPSRLTENKQQLDVIHERRGDSMPMRLDHILANIQLDKKFTENDVPQIFNQGSDTISRVKVQKVCSTSLSKKSLLDKPSPLPASKNYHSSGGGSHEVQQTLIPVKPPIQLLSKEYVSYLESYEASLISHFYQNDLFLDQKMLQGYQHHEDISEALRARLIDWILHCTQVCEMEDRNIFFIVVKIVDYFYCNVMESQPKSELQLTAIAAIFMASKLLQINHINLKFCHENIGHNKFTFKQITDRESQIMRLYDWEVSTQPSIYETFELLMMMLRRRCNLRITEDQTQSFLNQVLNLSMQLIRAHLCSYSSLKKKSVDIASACLQLALAYHTLELSRNKSKTSLSLQSSPEIHKKNIQLQQQQYMVQSEVLFVIESWREICERMLAKSISRIQPFTVEILQEVLRMREMLSLNQPGEQGGGGTRLKEIMVFTDHFVKWACKYIKDQTSTSSSSNVIATIMMFSTDEDEEQEDEEEDFQQNVY